MKLQFLSIGEDVITFSLPLLPRPLCRRVRPVKVSSMAQIHLFENLKLAKNTGNYITAYKEMNIIKWE